MPPGPRHRGPLILCDLTQRYARSGGVATMPASRALFPPNNPMLPPDRVRTDRREIGGSAGPSC